MATLLDRLAALPIDRFISVAGLLAHETSAIREVDGVRQVIRIDTPDTDLVAEAVRERFTDVALYAEDLGCPVPLWLIQKRPLDVAERLFLERRHGT